MNDDSTTTTTLCPSAQPNECDGMVFGVIVYDEGRRRVGYLTSSQPMSQDLLALAKPALPTEVFRIAAPCATHACRHFADGDCKLVTRIVQSTLPVVDRLPPCRIRPTCRWFLQEGKQACMRCPQVTTYTRDASEEWRRIALPDEPDQPQ